MRRREKNGEGKKTDRQRVFQSRTFKKEGNKKNEQMFVKIGSERGREKTCLVLYSNVLASMCSCITAFAKHFLFNHLNFLCLRLCSWFTITMHNNNVFFFIIIISSSSIGIVRRCWCRCRQCYCCCYYCTHFVVYCCCLARFPFARSLSPPSSRWRDFFSFFVL